MIKSSNHFDYNSSITNQKDFIPFLNKKFKKQFQNTTKNMSKMYT